jgi:hypothetical protein
MIAWLKKWWKYLLAALGLILGAVFALGGQAGGWISDVKGRRALRKSDDARKAAEKALAEQAKELAIANLRRHVGDVNKEASSAATDPCASIDHSTRR